MSGVCNCACGPPPGGVCNACGAVGPPLPGQSPPPFVKPPIEIKYTYDYGALAQHLDKLAVRLDALLLDIDELAERLNKLENPAPFGDPRTWTATEWCDAYDEAVQWRDWEECDYLLEHRPEGA